MSGVPCQGKRNGAATGDKTLEGKQACVPGSQRHSDKKRLEYGEDDYAAWASWRDQAW